MAPELLDAIRGHAAEDYPREACGLVIERAGQLHYQRCRNTASEPGEEFRIDPHDYAAAEDLGEIVAVVHSHPDASSLPSTRDLAMCEATGLPWHILSWPEGDLRTIRPKGDTPLLGRPFVHGLWDCWQVCADWYLREWGLTFPHYSREDGWWEDAQGPSLYEQAYANAGFVAVDTPQRGDMLVMAIGRTAHPNHAGIYLGSDPRLPGEQWTPTGAGPFLLHHLYGRPSEVIVFGGPWLDRTRLVLRHRDAAASG
ncbi:C40 family peptidase [Pseudomonas sp. GD03858]|uniref:C40 family peptidase n=1 Tax=unclassified Pseudomonas TaxID=196821 RepID=UPI002448B180|nr:MULTISPECIES: C40 family peptidase [unclassified Pseudomonas]MDH0645580.1 C40 family peptidase [Pseudomonas sp. GD03867]MDH0663282.1 C40 family peptidase [Pseudomonas sp. GD03858]